jgi:hypothetical protein
MAESFVPGRLDSAEIDRRHRMSGWFGVSLAAFGLTALAVAAVFFL